MVDPDLVSLPLANTFIRLALDAEELGYAFGSNPDQVIVAALLNNRASWLPPEYPHLLGAIQRLRSISPVWWHTLNYVHERNWRD